MTHYNITIKGEIVLAIMKSLKTQGVNKPYGFSVTDMATDVTEVLGGGLQAQDAALLANEARLIAENAELRERVSAARNEIEGMIHEICLLKSMLPMGYNYVTYPPSKEALEIQKRVEGKNG